MKYSELLIGAGWLMNNRCRCGGILKETWKKGLQTIYIYPTRGYFRGKKGKKMMSELESYLA